LRNLLENEMMAVRHLKELFLVSVSRSVNSEVKTDNCQHLTRPKESPGLM